MMRGMAGGVAAPHAGDAFGTLVAEDGLGGHGYAVHLASAAASNAMLADAVYFICLLHGRFPGVIDNAGDRLTEADAREWMYRATAAFAGERAFLTRLMVAAGPVPSTTGQAQSEAAVAAQTHALTVLSHSDRRGTSLGAALALALDWRPVRAILDRAAHRAGLQPPPCDLPPAADTLALASALSPPVERAMLFGARQLFLQHRGLLDLLETRAGVRGDGRE